MRAAPKFISIMCFQLPLLREAGYRLVLLLLLLGWCAQAGASNVIGVSPITDRIIQVHFDDGHIDYGKGPGQGTIYNKLLDTTAIYDLNRYLVTSPTDGQFGSGGRRPTHMGRKTKAGEVNDLFSQPNFVLEHWVYLQLPSPLKQGNTYTLSLGGLATNTNTVTFTFDAANLRSEAVHVTQLGLLPDAPKYAYISQWMGDFANGTIVDGKGEFAAYEGKRFDVVRVNDGSSVFNGTVQARKRYRDGSPQTNGPNDARSFWWPCGCDFGQNHSFSDVLEADFSDLTTPGDYKVVVQDMGSSYAFEISEHAYRDPFNYVLRGIGFQRQGVVLDLPDGRIRPRDFHPDDYPASRFRLASNWRWVDAPTHDAKIDNDTKIDKQYAGELPVWGWYHDAGDWDAYPQHGFIPLMLNILYDMKPGNFRDGDVGMRYKIAESDANWIDEGSNGLPDILDEASWLLRYWKRAKDVGLARGVTTGGVPGAYGGADAGALDGFPSWGDNDRPLEFVDEGPFATYQYAAVAAQYAYNLRTLGRNSEADSWLSEARSAWSWANNNIRDDDNTAFNGLVNKMRSVAAAALYKETKESVFQQRMKDMLAADSQYQGYEEGWGSPHYWEVTATIYGLLDPAEYPNLDRGFQDQVREHITTTADQNFVDPAAQRGYRYGFDDRKAQQIGMSTTPMLLTVIAAAELSNDRKYFETINTTSNFFLGGNQDHKTWISGLGERPVRYPFHPNSWFLYDFNSKVYSDESLPGYVPYGSSMQPDFFGWGYLWAGDEDFSKTSMYPYFRYQNWPAMEQRVGTRYSIPSSEFTVWQNMATSAFTYGYLNRPANSDYQFNNRPLVTLNVSQTISADGGVLTASTSGDTRHVKYYYEENFIGESFDRGDNFSVFWDPPLPGGTNGVLVTAVAYDDKGLISLPSDAGDRSVNIVGGTGVAVTSVSVTPNQVTLSNIRNTAELFAVISPDNASDRAVSWSSSNPSVVTVDANGRLTGVAPGAATVTVTTRDGGRTASASVTVEDLTCVSDLKNASFDSGLDNWTVNSGNPYTDANDALLPGPDAGIQQTFSRVVPAGANVTLRFRASVNDAGGYAGVGFDFRDASGAKLSDVNVEVDEAGERDYTVDADAPAGTAAINVWLYSQTHILRADNFCVVIEGNGGGGGSNNTFDQDDGPDGLVSLETEEHSAKSSGVGAFAGMNWTEVADGAASNGAFMVVPDNGNSNATEANATAGPRLDFVVDFVKTGTHYVWIRQRSPDAGDNSVNLGYNGSVFTEWNMPSPETTWRWSRCPTTFSVAGPGTNTFNVFMREDGTPIDRIVLTTNRDYNPDDSDTGTGPGSASGGCSSDGTITFERFDGIIRPVRFRPTVRRRLPQPLLRRFRRYPVWKSLPMREIIMEYAWPVTSAPRKVGTTPFGWPVTITSN